MKILFKSIAILVLFLLYSCTTPLEEDNTEELNQKNIEVKDSICINSFENLGLKNLTSDFYKTLRSFPNGENYFFKISSQIPYDTVCFFPSYITTSYINKITGLKVEYINFGGIQENRTLILFEHKNKNYGFVYSSTDSLNIDELYKSKYSIIDSLVISKSNVGDSSFYFSIAGGKNFK